MADGPRRFVAGHFAGMLGTLLGTTVSPSDEIIVAPAREIEPQWFVDHPTYDPADRAIWWALTSPGRRVHTASVIKAAIEELDALHSQLMADYNRHRVDQMRREGARSKLLEVLPDIADRIKQVKAIRAQLRSTRSNLERIHLQVEHDYRKEYHR